jgi:hypothetical protein
MSLINDALKRARESQQKNPPGGARPLPPVETRKRARDFNWVLPALIILLIIVACFFIGLMAKHTVTKIVNTTDLIATQEVETVVSQPLPDTNARSDTNALPASAPAPVPPVLPMLQGIFYDPTQPSAIVDGQTVYVGSRVEGWGVKEISKYTVTLEGTNGLQQKISLGE